MTPKPIALLLSILLIASAMARAETLPPATNRASIYTQLAAEYFRRGQVGVALEDVQKAIDADPKYAPAHNIAGLIYNQLQDNVAAQRHFQEALRLAPDDADINHNYGWYLCEHNQRQEGIRYYVLAARNPLYSTPEKSLINAGECAADSDDLDGARSFYLQALKARVSSAQARQRLIEVDLRRKDFDEAKRYLAELQKLVQPSATLAWLSLRVERGLGNKDGEARYADLLRKQYPDSIETSRLLANKYDSAAE
ncbi:Lipopolysaccharide assembly protein B [Andreprevotia sp. IGB-42]|uniref:type IV pilus biogenesis/stability protein PilW n=1 Tax=Andreprevotia sp. IGB-42 TaxID=2497473 RepID=UPI00135837A5|nr:type IV pilus biogenesis/stability protein PilW [Andreprevotia sp. IGB-42]KAF0814330.1 Lipopolysaccharide assembly protein B [Andreprevotia sp. IGB-42]